MLMDIHRLGCALAVLLLAGCTPTWQAPLDCRPQQQASDWDAV